MAASARARITMDRHTMHAPEAMNATEATYVFESTLACVGKAELAAGEAASRCGFSEEDCRHIAAAVREAVMNAVVHGSQSDPVRRVTVALESTAASLTVAVRDEGRGWDPATVPDPLAPENLLKSSGRGIFLIRAFMDEVRFATFAHGSEIMMTKFVRGSGRGANYTSNHPSKEPSQ
jgi:serine/threonine-protein kinase RsbW